MSHTVADLVVRTLEASGVKRIYGIPGDSLNAFIDALRRNRSLTWVHVRHEEAAAFAAAGDAAITGELAVAAVSCGPGNLHLINGLFDAQRSRVPVLVIAAHIPSAEIGTTYFQEIHPENLFRECSVYCELVSTTAQLPYVLNIAVRTALEKRGVSVLVVPGDILAAEVPEPKSLPPIVATPSVVRPSEQALDAAARAIDSATRVTILAGAGCADAHDELIALAARLQAPIVHAFRGKEFIEPDNPFDVGMTGLLGFSSGYRAMESSDLLLMVGTDFPYRDFYPQHTATVQIDLRGEQIGRRTTVNVALVGTAAETLDALTQRVTEKTNTGHLHSALHHYRSARRELDRFADDDRDRTPMHPQLVARTIDEVADDDAVFLPDVGTPVIWAARYLRMNGRRRLIGSFNHGSMANALPQAIGVQAAQPGRQVVTLSGDGGIAMLLGDLITLQQLRLPVNVVVFNNSSLGFVELEMKADGYPTFGTDLSNPNFAAVGTALGIHGQRVEHPDDLAGALRTAFAHDGPSLVEVMVARQELSIPPRISRAEVKGFALYATRSVLSGHLDELIDLAETNLERRVFE